eukprot:g2066.t1
MSQPEITAFFAKAGQPRLQAAQAAAPARASRLKLHKKPAAAPSASPKPATDDVTKSAPRSAKRLAICPQKALQETLKLLAATASSNWSVALPALLHALRGLAAFPEPADRPVFASSLLTLEQQTLSWLKAELTRRQHQKRASQPRPQKPIRLLLCFLSRLSSMDQPAADCASALARLKPYREVLSLALDARMLAVADLGEWAVCVGRLVCLLEQSAEDAQQQRLLAGADDQSAEQSVEHSDQASLTARQLCQEWDDELGQLLGLAFGGLTRLQPATEPTCRGERHCCHEERMPPGAAELLPSWCALVNAVLLELWPRHKAQHEYAQHVQELLQPETAVSKQGATHTGWRAEELVATCQQAVRYARAAGTVVAHLLADSARRHPPSLCLELVHWTLVRVVKRDPAPAPLPELCTAELLACTAHMDRIEAILSSQIRGDPESVTETEQVENKAPRTARQPSIMNLFSKEHRGRDKRCSEAEKAAAEKQMELEKHMRLQDKLAAHCMTKAIHACRQQLRCYLVRFWLQRMRESIRTLANFEKLDHRWLELWKLANL